MLQVQRVTSWRRRTLAYHSGLFGSALTGGTWRAALANVGVACRCDVARGVAINTDTRWLHQVVHGGAHLALLQRLRIQRKAGQVVTPHRLVRCVPCQRFCDAIEAEPELCAGGEVYTKWPDILCKLTRGHESCPGRLSQVTSARCDASSWADRERRWSPTHRAGTAAAACAAR